MSTEDLQVDLREHALSRIVWTATNLADAAYLVLWIIVQWLISRTYDWFPLTDMIDLLNFWIFRFLFAISTLVPVTLFIYKDIRIMYVRVQREINQMANETENE